MLDRIERVAAFGLAIILVLGGCDASSPPSATGATGASSQPSAKQGGTLVWAVPWSVASLDPHREGESTTEIMMSNVYQTLVNVNADDPSKVTPSLAASWTASDLNTVFTFNLVKNAQFSSGNPVTADDVKFSLDRLWNLGSIQSFLLAGIKSVDVVDTYTVRITIKAPDAAWLAKLTAPDVAIIDSKLAKQNGGTSGSDAKTTDKLEPYFMALNTLGSGPFVLAKYLPNDQFELARNPKYWGPAPALDKVILKNIPDSTTQRQLLERGDIDIAGALDFASAQQLESTSGVKVSYASSPQLIYLFMNTAPDVSEPLSKKLVRQAVSHAIDYDGLLKLAGGHAQKPPTTIPLGFLGADTVAAPKLDLTLAKQLMAQAGYANGFEIKVAYPQVVSFGMDLGLVGAKLQADLAQIGIKIELQPTTLSGFLTIYRTAKAPFGFSVMSGDYMDSDNYVGTFWSSDVNFFSKRVNYKNPQIDQLYPQSLSTSGDARVQVYKQLQQLFLDDPVFIGLLQPQYVFGYRTRVNGLKYRWGVQKFDLGQVSLN